MSGISRRTLLKGGVAGLSSLVLGPDFFWQCLGAEDARPGDYVSLYTGRVTHGRPTTCGLCPAGCGMLVFVDEGRLVGLAGNPDHPYNRGALCVFGSAAARLTEGPCRIRKPLRRVGKRGEGRWEEIAWGEALRTVTENLRARQGNGSPPEDALAICVSDRDVTPVVDRFLAFYRRGLLAVAEGHEHCVEAGVRRSFGPVFDGEVDLAKADRILNFGANPLGSIRRLVGTARQWAEGETGGAGWITLDPRLSETAAASHAWIPLRPGTDGAFALAVARQIVKHDRVDRPFIERATDIDCDALREILAPWTAEKVASVCQVPAERIRWAAEAFAAADRPVAILGSGVTGRRGGLEDAQAILLLNCLVGSIARGGGCRQSGGIRWRQPDPLPPATRPVPVQWGTLFWDLQTRNRRIGCLLSHGANPAVTDPDAGKTAETLKDPNRVSFHAALASYWNETAELADIVLPASTFLESWRVHQPYAGAGSSAWVSLRQPVLRTEGETRSLDELLLEIAGSLGGEMQKGFPFKGVEEYYRLLLNGNLAGSPAAAGFREARKKGFLMIPVKDRGPGEKARVQSVVTRCVHHIAAASGSKDRKRGDAAQKTLLLYSSATRGGTDYPCDWVDEIDHADPMLIHPKAAKGLGLADGDRVMVKGPAGSVSTRVRLTEGIHPDAVGMAAVVRSRRSRAGCAAGAGAGKGSGRQRRWWEGEAYGGNARQVIPWPEDPHRGAPGWMDTVVTLTRVERNPKG